jgi:HK97 family phage prohead protease
MERIEVKFAPEDMNAKTGEFSGYAAIFGTVDSHGDVIEPGAFLSSLQQWQAKGSLPAMKMMHGTTVNPFSGSDLPVGKWNSMKEDQRGLLAHGKLSGMDTDRGRYHYALMEDGALSGLSIGFKPVKQARGTGNVKRRLETINLREVSLVPDGSHDDARITDLKSWNDGQMPSLSQFEDFLREAGFSKSQRTFIATKGLAPLLRGEPGNPTDAEEYFQALAALTRG